MKIDLTFRIQKEMWSDIFNNEKMTSLGHLGTHFDVMNKEFSLNNTIRRGKVIDVSQIRDRDINIPDIESSEICKDDFVMFHTGFLREVGYGTQKYFKLHPQLSMELIKSLINSKVSLIGIDAAGVRRGVDHTKTDQFCSDNGVFIIENLDNLKFLLEKAGNDPFDVYTFPINFEGMSGLPCRVIAEV